jgi:hypothetical protein
MENALPATREADLLLTLDAPHLRTCVDLLSRSGRTMESNIRGTSMGSTIPDGARIRVQWTGGKTFRPGQIVACLEQGFLFAHRVVYVRGNTIITQGDGWILCDPPVRVSQVIGEVISYREGGEWHSPIAEPVRLTSDARAARRQVRIIASCLRLNMAFARFVARQMIRLYTFRRHCRQVFVIFCRRG